MFNLFSIVNVEFESIIFTSVIVREILVVFVMYD